MRNIEIRPEPARENVSSTSAVNQESEVDSTRYIREHTIRNDRTLSSRFDARNRSNAEHFEPPSSNALRSQPATVPDVPGRIGMLASTSMNRTIKTRTRLKRIANLITITAIASTALVAVAGHMRIKLPPESELLPIVEEAPEQTNHTDRAFAVNWRGAEYAVYPVAEYEITGLTVTRNDIGAFADIYHTLNSVDVVDVCLVWGANTSEDVYRNVEFWSEPFSCWVRPKNEIGANEFAMDQLSNTHILAKDEAMAENLNTIRVGDQIRLRGKLVNYHPAGASEMLRKSSLVRTDTGNGACEVMYVEEFKVLKRNNPGWNRTYDIAKFTMLSAIALKLVTFVLFPYLELRSSEP